MKKEFIFCHTISGEGYSTPEFKAFSNKEEANEELSNKLYYLEQHSDGKVKRKSNNDFSVETGDDENPDYHRLRIIEVNKNNYHLICNTEPNEVAIPYSNDNKQLVAGYMNSCIASQRWDDGEDEYDGYSHSYGAHATDGYIHYEIVSATQILVETLKEDAENDELICALEEYEGNDFVVNDELLDFIRAIENKKKHKALVDDNVFRVVDINESEIPDSLLKKLHGLQMWTDTLLQEHVFSNDDLKEKLHHNIALNTHEQSALKGIELRCEKYDAAYFRIIERK